EASLLNVLGLVADRKGRLQQAWDYYNKAIALAPTFVPALVNRAALSIRELDYDLAEEDLKQALGLQPQQVDALVALGVVYQKTGRYQLAKESYEKALDANLEQSQARFNLGLLMAERLNDQNGAVRLFSEVLQMKEAPANLKSMAKSYLDDLK